MDLLLVSAASAVLFLLSLPAFRLLGRKLPRLLDAQPFVMSLQVLLGTSTLMTAAGLPIVLTVIVALVAAAVAGYWGCGLMLNEFLRKVRF